MKQWLEEIVHRAGLHTKTNPDMDGSYSVITRLAIEKLESSILGDFRAITVVYSRPPRNTLEPLRMIRQKDNCSHRTGPT